MATIRSKDEPEDGMPTLRKKVNLLRGLLTGNKARTDPDFWAPSTASYGGWSGMNPSFGGSHLPFLSLFPRRP
jgi:hypothetical protein